MALSMKPASKPRGSKVAKLAHRVVHLLTGLNADRYAAEMRGQLATKAS
jgi:hypothetical protein